MRALSSMEMSSNSSVPEEGELWQAKRPHEDKDKSKKPRNKAPLPFVRDMCFSK
jgi:hypothetical protein